MQANILIADDDENILSALRLMVKGEKWQSDTASSPHLVLHALKQNRYSLLLLDMNYQRDTTSGAEGLQLIEDIRALNIDTPIIAMTGWGSVELAVEAMRKGADDFIEKPWDNTRLLTIMRQQLQWGIQQQKHAELVAENRALKTPAPSDWVAESPLMHELINKAQMLADSDISVILTGENGTGKSLFAQWIHEQSNRKAQRFVSVNMGAIPENLFESELFGHVKGAFTDAKETRLGRFELADKGSLFLDEIGNMPSMQQAKLLRVLESGEFEKIGSNVRQKANVRIISATNADLAERVQQGIFRQDLFYRLNGVELRIPALRERPEDILPLALHFIQLYTKKYQRNCHSLTEGAQHALRSYSWPGNIRELKHGIERAVVLSAGDTIDVPALAINTTDQNTPPASETWADLTMEQAEKRLLELALAKHKGNVNAAADALGISRSAFYRRLEKYRT